jgi:outer membrane protein insertion porin family
VTFSGPLQLAASGQEQIAASIKEHTDGNSLEDATDAALERVRAGWQDFGYFKVQVSGDARTLTSSPVSERIALSVHIDEGVQYDLGAITFKHNKAISNIEALRALFPIKDGDVFSREKIAKGLENLRKAYGQLGYINFTSVPDTSFDDEKKLVHLAIDFDEGKQFYVSRVNVEGLDEPARQALLKDLPVKRGQVYNSRLWELSLLKHASMFPECECRYHAPLRLDDRTGTVAVTLDFRPCSTD